MLLNWKRHVFNTCNQHDDETIDQHVMDLKKKAQTCKLHDLKDLVVTDLPPVARPCQHNGKKYNIEFEVLDQDVPNILGLPTSVKLNLIKCINTVQEQNIPDSSNTKFYEKFKDVFDGLGCISDVIYHINIDPSCQPIIHPPCHVPIKLRPMIHEELTHMESLDVIEKVNTPISWVNSMVTIVKPNETLHIWIDP